MPEQTWTDQQFNQMSWHDNHVHGFRLVAGTDGSGELILELDHIVEWIREGDHRFRFRILPVTLTFHEVVFLRFSIDYAAPGAAFGPFSIGEIERRTEQNGEHPTHHWKISINWPSGEVSFKARGFTQQGRGEPVLSQQQFLNPAVRGDVPIVMPKKK